MSDRSRFWIGVSLANIASCVAGVALGTADLLAGPQMMLAWGLLAFHLGYLKRKERRPKGELHAFDTHRPEIHSWSKDEEYFKRYLWPLAAPGALIEVQVGPSEDIRTTSTAFQMELARQQAIFDRLNRLMRGLDG